MRRALTAVLISGRGSNMGALIEAARAPDYPARIVLVVSNRPDAAGLDNARDAGVETLTIDHAAFGKGDTGRRRFEAALDAALRARHIELVALAGFMRLLGAEFVAAWTGRLINIHPSLLPDYKGVRVHERMIGDGARFAGCTVHFVAPEMDSGEIIGQAAIMVEKHDTPQTLAARTLKLEHRLYPECLAKVAAALARANGG